VRVALFSDVHGNLAALEALLARFEEEGPFDVTVFAGDAVLYGPSPADVVERLRSSGIVCLKGNCDGAIAGQVPQALPPDPALQEVLKAHKVWTEQRLSPEQIRWLADRPVLHRISPGTGNPRHDLVVMHATPRSFDDDVRFCSPELSAAEAEAVFGGLGAGVVAFGHRHGSFVNAYGNLTLVNVSSSSLTPDGQALAAYTVATWHGDHWTLEQRRIPYDVRAELQRAQEREFPVHPWWQHVASSHGR